MTIRLFSLFSLFSGVLLAATAGLVTAAVPAHASTGVKELELQTGDTFTTGQEGVLCEVRSAGFLQCTRNTASPYGVKTNVCGNTALDGIDLYTAGWKWDCATDVQIIPTKASNAWAIPHRLPTDAALNAPVIPGNWTFTTGGLPCHVSSNGALGCAAPDSAKTGFVADSRYIYPRGVTQSGGSSELVLRSGDTFTTGQKGVLCQVDPGNSLECTRNTADPYGVKTNICGSAALVGIKLSTTAWSWVCATDVQIIPTKASNAWAIPHGLSTDAALNAPVIPGNWTFIAGGLPSHVSSDGALGSSASEASNTGFVADARYIYPRGTHAKCK